MRLRKNDQVLVIQGKDKGKRGRLMRIFPGEGVALVEKINYRKVAVRRTRNNPKGGIVEMEGKIPLSKLQLICPRCSKPTRIGYELLADGTKQRSCKKCREVLGV